MVFGYSFSQLKLLVNNYNELKNDMNFVHRKFLKLQKQYLCRWQMDTFLELPLDRDLYKPKTFSKCDKPPLRVLITEAGSKTAHHLIYKICSGQVFGPNQPIILHLVNAKGCINHRATLLDLEECGFPFLADFVVSAEPEKSYGKVDVVVFIALFEEISGHNMINSFLCQLNKTRNVTRNMTMYAKPNAKLVVSSPSTKGIAVLLACIKAFEPQMNTNNITGVVLLDEIIAKHHTGAHLKTTSDAIKNVVIWGASTPDFYNASVFLYPTGDNAASEKVEIPVLEAIENQNWIYTKLIPSLYRRICNPSLVKHGGAMASATARHLKLLFQGTDIQKEIVSMAVIIPPSEPYGITKGIGFAIPVKTVNGDVTIREDVDYDTTTHIMNLRTMHNLHNDSSIPLLTRLIKFIKNYEETTKKEFLWNQHTYLTRRHTHSSTFLRYIISRRLDETSPAEEKEVSSKKSITWDEAGTSQKVVKGNVKSVLRFNLNMKNYV